MKTEALKKRLTRNRPMTMVTIRIPEDVIEDQVIEDALGEVVR